MEYDTDTQCHFYDAKLSLCGVTKSRLLESKQGSLVLLTSLARKIPGIILGHWVFGSGIGIDT